MPARRRERTSKGVVVKQQIPLEHAHKERPVKSRNFRDKILQRSSNRYLAQLTAVKANNKSLAAALDEARKDYRVLQEGFLGLQQERQQLLEKVASLENDHEEKKDVSLAPAVNLLKTVQAKIQQAVGILENRAQPFAKAVNILSPIVDTHNEAGKTPYTIPASGNGTKLPRFQSTPDLSNNSQNSAPMLITPCAIQFSDSESVTGTSKHQETKRVSPTEGNQPKSSDNSPGLPESTQEELEPGIHRPKRKCASLSLSYKELSLHKKLRRGDPFIEMSQGWSPQMKKKYSSKTTSKKSKKPRKVLCDLTNKNRK